MISDETKAYHDLKNAMRCVKVLRDFVNSFFAIKMQRLFIAFSIKTDGTCQ